MATRRTRRSASSSTPPNITAAADALLSASSSTPPASSSTPPARRARSSIAAASPPTPPAPPDPPTPTPPTVAPPARRSNRAGAVAPSDLELEQLIIEQSGNVTAVAQAIGFSRVYVYQRINASDALKDALETAREALKDEAEERLRAMVNDVSHKDQFNAIKFFLSTRAADRGFGDRQRVELTGKNGLPFTVTKASLTKEQLESLSIETLRELAGLMPEDDD